MQTSFTLAALADPHMQECETTESRTALAVIASEAKQSIHAPSGMDCLVALLLAMTAWEIMQPDADDRA